MILNAAKESPSLSQFFPPFTIRHYSYLRDVHPLLVPKLIFLEQRAAGEQMGNYEMDEMRYLKERLNDIGVTNSLQVEFKILFQKKHFVPKTYIFGNSQNLIFNSD